MKPEKPLLKETGRIAAGVAILIVLMFAVYAIIGKFGTSVLLGGLYTGILCVVNFFIMGLTVQSVSNRAAEKQRTDEEIEELTIQMKTRMKLSYNLRMVALFALLVIGLAVFHFDPLATILPVLFPSIVVRILQIVESKKSSVSKGSEKA